MTQEQIEIVKGMVSNLRRNESFYRSSIVYQAAGILLGRRASALEALLAEREELIKTLKPFANYACNLENGETCECHNCKARTAINAAMKGEA